LILYGIAAEESIGQLCLGGVVPGIVLTLMFCAWVFIASLKAKDNPAADVEIPAGSDLTRRVLETEKTHWAERIKALIKIIPFILLIVLVLMRSEEHTSELQSRFDLVCRLLLEKKK